MILIDMEEGKNFDESQHSFAAHVTYDGFRLAIHAGPDTNNIPLPNTSRDIKDSTTHQLIDTIYYPKQVQFFNTLSQPTLVDWFIQEVKARSPGEAEIEMYDYISRILTYGHKIGREMYQHIITAAWDLPLEELHKTIEQEIWKEKESRALTDTRLKKYQIELDKLFPKMAAYFEQDYRAESNYTRIEKEDIQTELLMFGIENYVKNIAPIDTWFIHRN